MKKVNASLGANLCAACLKLTSTLRYMLFMMLLAPAAMYGQSTASSQQPEWPLEPPAQAPQNLEEIRDLLQKYPDYFHDIDLRKDTLWFHMCQLLDHTKTADKEGKCFISQRIVITKYIGADKPTLIHTSGYAVDSSLVVYYDLAKALNANMIQVEHRFTGESYPMAGAYAEQGGILANENFWNFATAYEQSTDLAYVVNTLKRLKIFNGQWIASGVSKCGMTSTFLSMYYPETCDVYVPFCAPFCNSLNERLDRYVHYDYATRLARHSKTDSITWKRGYQPIRWFLQNKKLQQALIERMKTTQTKMGTDISDWETNDYILVYLQGFCDSQFTKVTYYRVPQWQGMIPSQLAIDAEITKEYVDSMYVYLTATDDTLNNYIYNNTDSYAVRRTADVMTTNQRRASRSTRRADATNTTINGIRSDIYQAREYDVQTLYELGHFVSDFSYVSDLASEDVIEGLVMASLNGYHEPYSTISGYFDLKIKDNIGFIQDPLNPEGPNIICQLSDGKPFLPKVPIAPYVRQHVKTTQVPILFVYGEFDPWTQAGITDQDIAGNPHVQRIEVPSGIHNLDVMSPTYSSDPNIGLQIVDKVKQMLQQATAVKAIRNTTSVSTTADKTIYDLQGRRITTPVRNHLYIRGGQKFIYR